MIQAQLHANFSMQSGESLSLKATFVSPQHVLPDHGNYRTTYVAFRLRASVSAIRAHGPRSTYGGTTGTDLWGEQVVKLGELREIVSQCVQPAAQNSVHIPVGCAAASQSNAASQPPNKQGERARVFPRKHVRTPGRRASCMVTEAE